MSEQIKAGFIGLGAMGEPMAGHLHAAGLLSVVGNRSIAKAQLPNYSPRLQPSEWM